MANTFMAGSCVGEGEVAVPDRGHRFDREVGRREEPQMLWVAGSVYVKRRMIVEMAMRASRPATTKVSPLLPSSITPAACRAMRREMETVRSGDRRVRLGSMPPSLSSSSVPSTATRSPGTT